jgi:hypothetical protein
LYRRVLQLHLGALGERGGLVDHVAAVLDAGFQRGHVIEVPRF